MIIDANNLILGRLGTFVAKKALLGEKIDIVNCENCVITGDRNRIFEDYDNKLKRGIPSKGPFVCRMPNRFVKRAIRGMLPYKKERGRKAFKNIKCYVGVPENLKSQKSKGFLGHKKSQSDFFVNQKIDTIKNANVEKIPNLKYIKIKDICVHIGAKIK